MSNLKPKQAFIRPAIIIASVIFMIIAGYFITIKFVLPKAVNKAVEKTANLTADSLKSIDFSKAANLEINEQANTVIINQSQGNVTLAGGSAPNLRGAVKYLGLKPIMNVNTTTDGSKFTYQSTEQPEDINLSFPSQSPTDISVGSGASIVNLNLAESNTPNVNVASGTGEVNVTFSKKYSTKASLAVGAGQLNLKVPSNAALKISSAQGTKLNVDFGEAYQKVGESYQSKNYEVSPVKIDLTIGQAVGGFNLDIIE